MSGLSGILRLNGSRSGRAPLNRFTLLTALGCVTALVLCAPAAGNGYPPETTLGYGKPPDLPRPGYLEPIIDPVFGTEVVRITRLRPLRPERPIVRHVYSKIEPWNADESLLLTGTEQPRLVLDGDTYRPLYRYWGPGTVWSNVDPQKLFGTRGARFGFANPAPGEAGEAFTVLHRFGRYREIDIGYGEGNLSNDDRYVALIGIRRNGAEEVIVYDLAAGRVLGRRAMRRGIDNATMSQSGEFVVVQGDRNGRDRNEGVDVYDRELRFLRKLTSYVAHGDVGYTAAGEEAWVAYARAQGRSIGAYPLAGGKPINVIDADPGTWGGHVSCRNIHRPGWCYISDAGHSPRLWRGYDQVWAQRIARDGPVQAFAHEHHSYDTGYYHQPQAVPSRDGSRVLWASDWDGGRAAPVFDYVASGR